MFNKLSSIIKKIEGNVLVICLDNNLTEKFKNNNKINLYSINSSNNSPLSLKLKPKIKRTNKGKNINIKKLRKYIKKKSVDYLILNIDEVIRYYKYIIRDTILLNNNTIYIYSNNIVEKEFLITRYKRYNVNIKVDEYKTGYILTIDNKNGKNNFFKDKFYYIKDTLYNIAEIVGSILIS